MSRKIGPVVLDLLKDAVRRAQDRAYARPNTSVPQTYDLGWGRGYEAGYLNGFKRALELLNVDVSDAIRPHPVDVSKTSEGGR